MTNQAEQSTTDRPDPLHDARVRLASGEWFEALAAARAAVPDDARAAADRLDIVAEASWWLGNLGDCIEAREQAYARYESVEELRAAGRCAVWLWEHHQIRAKPAIAGAWLRRARRALAGEAECVELGALLLREAETAHGAGDLEQAEALARQVHAMARRLGSLDIEAEALQTVGRVLIDAGRVAEGMGHLDEAMLSAVEGRLGPYTTGKVYCSLISACEELGDHRRAAEWTDATIRWAERHPLAVWPGICRVHHASLLQLRGDWTAAEREARRACKELDGFHVRVVAAGYVEIGDIRRRLGDLDGAEAAFAKAEELSGQQSAGLALVRLAQRRIDDATAIITRLLAERAHHQLARGKLLPARVQIAVAAGDLAAAAKGVEELEAIADDFDSPALLAAATSARGRLLFAQGDAPGACAALRDALHRWQELEIPYEQATVRLLLGRALQECGDDDGADHSLAAAAAIFERLGASLELHDGELDPASALPAGLTEREGEVLALVAAGHTNRAIAGRLHLSERTVARHLSNIFAKVGVSSRTAAAAFAFEHHIRLRSDP